MSKSIRLFIVILSLLALTAPVYAQTIPYSTSATQQSDATQIVIPAGESIQIGMGTDLSNLVPEMGADFRNGALIAIDEINAAGGIEGFQIEMNVQDDRCDGADATNVANLFAADPQIVAIVGHVCSGASIPASLIYNEARIPMVSISTASAFTAQGYDVVNRVTFTDAAQGVVDARFMYEILGATSIAVLHDNTDYGKGLADEVNAEFERLGGMVVALEAIDPEDQNYRSILTDLTDNVPDAIFFGGYQNQSALLVTQMQEVGLENTVFLSDDGTFTQQYIDSAGEAAEGSYASFVDDVAFADTEGNEAFDLAYEEAFGSPPDDIGPFHSHAYDAAMIIINAISEVAVVDDDGNLVIDREALIEAIRATEEHPGLTGVLACDANGECGSGLIGLNVVENGEWVAVDVPAEIQFGEPFMQNMSDSDEDADADSE